MNNFLNNFLYICILFVIVVLIIKVIKNNTNNYEGFSNIINKFVKKNKNNMVNKLNKGKKMQEYTFNDLVKETENLNASNYTISSIKQNLFDYINSFNKDKFKNTTETTNDVYDNFNYFKNKFYDIFK